jgi:hypothetical protein
VIYVNEKKLCSSKGTKADNSSFYWNKSFTFEAGNSDKLLLKAISQNGLLFVNSNTQTGSFK